MTDDSDQEAPLDPLAVQGILLAWAKQHEAAANYLRYLARHPEQQAAQKLVFFGIPELAALRLHAAWQRTT